MSENQKMPASDQEETTSFFGKIWTFIGSIMFRSETQESTSSTSVSSTSSPTETVSNTTYDITLEKIEGSPLNTVEFDKYELKI